MNRGEVVLLDWPYRDRSGSKIRPAVVVQADYLTGILDDTVLVHITSKRHTIPGPKVELDPAIETASGLLRTCYAFCPNLLMADPADIDSTIGVLFQQAMRQIEECLKATLGIPQRKGCVASDEAAASLSASFLPHEPPLNGAGNISGPVAAALGTERVGLLIGAAGSVPAEAPGQESRRGDLEPRAGTAEGGGTAGPHHASSKPEIPVSAGRRCPFIGRLERGGREPQGS